MSLFQQRQTAQALALMDDKQRKAYQEQLAKQGRQQGALRLGAGAVDFFGGQRAQKQADAQIAELGEQAEGIRTQLGEMRAPGSMDPSTVAEATRNAAILGFQSEADDPSDDLARQAMALESGADPSKLYAASTQADQAADAQQRAESQQQFQQGLEMAQTDALNRFKQDYQTMAGDLQSLEGEIGALQQESLLAQQRKQSGLQGAVTGGGQFLSSGGLDEIKSAFGGKPQEEDEGEKPLYGDDDDQLPEGSIQTFEEEEETIDDNVVNPPGYGTVLGGGTNNDGTPDYDGDPTNSQAYGGSVQQTPGEYDHDTNDMILMAQGKHGQLVDTGIRQTGGEYVIDPFDAGNMRQGFEKIDPLELEAVRTGRADLRPELLDDLMQLYDAVRFIREPQFQDDYYEKKMNGYA
jgi:hypothetical protein